MPLPGGPSEKGVAGGAGAAHLQTQGDTCTPRCLNGRSDYDARPRGRLAGGARRPRRRGRQSGRGDGAYNWDVVGIAASKKGWRVRTQWNAEALLKAGGFDQEYLYVTGDVNKYLNSPLFQKVRLQTLQRLVRPPLHPLPYSDPPLTLVPLIAPPLATHSPLSICHTNSATSSNRKG